MQPETLQHWLSGFNTEVFVALLAAHILADFLLQSDRDVRDKRHPRTFAKHIGIVTGLSYLLTGLWGAWLPILLLGLSHAGADAIKIRLESQTRGWGQLRLFLADQSLHLAVIALIALWLTPANGSGWWVRALGEGYTQGLVLIAGLIACVQAGNHAIGLATQPFRPEPPAGSLPRDNRASEVIGQLERLLLFFFILGGTLEGIGFLVAAKSIFRFSSLNLSNPQSVQEKQTAEYILVGTLLSFSWGILGAWLFLGLLDQV